MDNRSRTIAVCGLVLILALYVVGIVSHGVIRHFVQTAPVWPAVWLGYRRSPWTKWAALSPLVLWLVLMINIWLLLLGLPHLLSGNFTPIEIALTIIIGVAAVVGIATALRVRAAVPSAGAVGMLLLMASLQILAIWISFSPGSTVIRGNAAEAFATQWETALRLNVPLSVRFAKFSPHLGSSRALRRKTCLHHPTWIHSRGSNRPTFF